MGWVARLGLWLGLAVAPLTGCTTGDKLFCCPDWLHGSPLVNDNAVCQVVATWQSEVQWTIDPVNYGSTLPGLAGKVYLFGQEANQPLVGGGELEVEVFDESRPNAPPQRLEKYKFDRKSLRELMRQDPIGCGYTVFLPLTAYRPDITQVRFKVCYKTERGNPLYTISNTTAIVHGDRSNQSLGPVLAKAVGMPLSPAGGPQQQVYQQQPYQQQPYQQQVQASFYQQQQQQQYQQQQQQQWQQQQPQWQQPPPANMQRFAIPTGPTLPNPGLQQGQYPPQQGQYPPQQGQYPPQQSAFASATTGVPGYQPTQPPAATMQPMPPVARKPEAIQTGPPADLLPHLRPEPGTAPPYTPPNQTGGRVLQSVFPAVPPMPPPDNGRPGQPVTTGLLVVPPPQPGALEPAIPQAKPGRAGLEMSSGLPPTAPAVAPVGQIQLLPPIATQPSAAESGESSGLRVLYSNH